MRVWDLPPAELCDRHLLGEHREVHALWTILAEGRRGYARHPETARWRGSLAALRLRHDRLASEMETRGFRHATPLHAALARGRRSPRGRLLTLREQRERLLAKGCRCPERWPTEAREPSGPR
ncbi:MAG TPA: pyrimidine dimer DNA glycosylase/endonuclease V [Candidatus Thermoplasmatota archaeon]|nr:pyrimidine dimer DNA glycosylase/endonuclease V [Candidatus Thermoplasmatota archaeon]